MYKDAFTQYRIDVDHSILDMILEPRNQDHRYKNGRGWQSYPVTGQPYAWFDSAFRQVSAALVQAPLTAIYHRVLSDSVTNLRIGVDFNLA